MLLSLSQFCCYFRLPCALHPARHFQVDPIAFEALVECVASADFDTCELVPAGGTANLSNPLGGIATDMAGPARYHDTRSYCMLLLLVYSSRVQVVSLETTMILLLRVNYPQGGGRYLFLSRDARYTYRIYYGTEAPTFAGAFIYTMVEYLDLSPKQTFEEHGK